MELKDGKALVGIAREVIEHHVRDMAYYPEDYPDSFSEKGGVFTTIHTYPENDLRGCIGYPEPYMPLIEALIESSKAVTVDPRFPFLDEEELGNIIVEVSVLTKPERIEAKNPEEYPKKIKVGRDGLILERGPFKGLLLPQVAIELKWDEKQFLENVSMKAGLPPKAWKEHGIRIHSFRSEVFGEEKPRGNVKKVS